MWGVSCVRKSRVRLRARASLWRAGACVAYPVRGAETPNRTCGTRGAERARRSRTLVTPARDADVRIPKLFGLPAFAPASADGTARSDGGDAPEATDKPRERSLRSHATRTSGYRSCLAFPRSLRRAPTARPAPTEATLRRRRTNHASTPVRYPHPRTCDATTVTTVTTQVTK